MMYAVTDIYSKSYHISMDGMHAFGGGGAKPQTSMMTMLYDDNAIQ